MTPDLEPRARAALIRCEGVSGAIYVDAVARSNVVGAGAISGGCLGVRFGLRYLRDAIAAAITRLYPAEDWEDLGYCPVDLQVVCSEHQNAAPLDMPDEERAVWARERRYARLGWIATDIVVRTGCWLSRRFGRG